MSIADPTTGILSVRPVFERSAFMTLPFVAMAVRRRGRVIKESMTVGKMEKIWLMFAILGEILTWKDWELDGQL
jgi:hypothetical protein